MSRRPCIFRQRDVTKAAKGVVGAGVGVLRVEVDKDGRIVVVAAQGHENDRTDRGVSEWDAL